MIYRRPIKLTLLALILFALCTLISPSVAFAVGSDNNPFSSIERTRDERLAAAINKTTDLPRALNSNQILEENKQKAEEIKPAIGKNYIVKFKENVSMQQIFNAISSYTYRLIGKSEQRMFLLELDDLKVFKQLTADIVEFIENDTEKNTYAISSDPYFEDQWALPAINLPSAWDITKGSNTVKVAVIDSGVYRSQPDLVNADIRNGWDYIFDEFTDWDSTGHGTEVTGIIGAATNNNVGISGINWNVAIIPMRVVYSDGTALSSNLITAIYDAADIACDVINISLGGNTYSSAEATAIAYAISKGSIVVASAGNDGTSSYMYPASYDGVISVGSIEGNFSRSTFSQFNDKVTVTAPGGHILTTSYWIDANGYDYSYVSGTSFSAPQISGVAALASACDPTITAGAFKALIQSTSYDLGSPGYDNYYGYGLIDANRLLNTVVHRNDALITADTIPAAMEVGQTYNVSVTVQNDGGTTWTASSGYRLGAVGESDPFAATRQFLAVDSIAPGQSKTFTFTMTAPSTPGAYTTDWRMLKEGIEWFGQSLTKNVVVSAHVQSVHLNKNSTIILLGNNETLLATILPANAVNKNVYWTTSNGSVAAVDTNGKVTAGNLGTATITVTTVEGAHQASCVVTVPDVQAVENFVTRFYQLCLNRAPDSGGRDYWKNQLLFQGNTGAAVACNFILGPEFIASNVTDSDFLDIMYSAFFNRSADASGKAYWQGVLDNGMSRLFILANFVNSNEFSTVCMNYGITRGSIQLSEPADLYPQITALVTRFYVKCLDRRPDTIGLNYWVNQLSTHQSTGAALARGFVFSPEFTSKNLSDSDYIVAIYRVFFNREPDSGGLAYWVGQLTSGSSRSNVLSGFIFSPEFSTLCNNAGIQVGA